MSARQPLSHGILKLLRCPSCGGALDSAGDFFRCTEASCSVRYPVVDGIPILISERTSVFTFDDFVSNRGTFFGSPDRGNWKKSVARLVPSIGVNLSAGSNYRELAAAVRAGRKSPRVLVLGGSIPGEGMEPLLSGSDIELVETDVSFGPRTSIICDAHDIPFASESFDAVVVQAVLEHVVDPYRCVEEIHRVLAPTGLVYAETPFMQQVHGGRYDFTRFTHLGHRRLFRRFDEVKSGVACGPGMALAWAYQYFLLSFARSRGTRAALRVFAAFTSFYLKWFDRYLAKKPGALDAASGYFFFGRKSEQALPDRDLIGLYRGAGS
jgi:SAM-dependent methyltransferase